jgi:hypothetical protein
MRPRQIAKIMLEDFVNGKPFEAIPSNKMTPEHRIALTHARNAASRVIFYARRIRGGEEVDIPTELRLVVTKYERNKRANNGA